MDEDGQKLRRCIRELEQRIRDREEKPQPTPNVSKKEREEILALVANWKPSP
jgi:hypothetical protein